MKKTEAGLKEEYITPTLLIENTSTDFTEMSKLGCPAAAAAPQR